jgi:LEA14-like dessication related protein
MRTATRFIATGPILRAILLFLGPLLLPACAAFLAPPRVEVVGVELVTLGLESGTAEVSLDVTNEGSKETTIRALLYTIEVRRPGDGGGWVTLADGSYTREVLLPGKRTERVKVPVPFEYDALGAAVMSFLAEGEIPYRVRGEVWLGRSGLRVTVPFRDRGILKP